MWKVSDVWNENIFKRNLLSFRYKVVLNSDSKAFDGLGRISDKQIYLTEDQKWDDRPFSFKVYTPCRTVLVLALAGDVL